MTCLFCDRDARIAARRRHGRLLIRLCILALILAGVVMGGSAVARAFGWPGGKATPGIAEAAMIDPPASLAPPAADASALPGPADVQTERPAFTLPAPKVPPGRSALPDGITLVRSGSVVTVNFDVLELRTRRAEKFERIVRATLPAVYGPPVDSLLQSIPLGSLVEGADLLTELPERGVHLPLTGTPVVSLWPQTRPGRDGPLVVSYRVEPRL